MTINLYREDGYSLWVLFTRFPELLRALGDSTPPDDPGIVVFYRPSFGRQSDSPTGMSKQFGEFDILIGTPQAVYPIESKPEECGELNHVTNVLTLRDVQTRRHGIFRTYRELWQPYRPKNWKEFESVALAEFSERHPGWTLAGRQNLLGKNLEFVLRSLENCGEKIQDTILFFHQAGKQVAFTSGQGFVCCTMPLEMVAGSNFVSIDGVPARIAG